MCKAWVPPSVETGQEKANRMIARELKRMGWEEEELRRRRKGEAHKVKLALLLREETTMTLAWIAGRLPAGCRAMLPACPIGVIRMRRKVKAG